jgi:hypothetical protein
MIFCFWNLGPNKELSLYENFSIWNRGHEGPRKGHFIAGSTRVVRVKMSNAVPRQLSSMNVTG